MHSSSPSNHHVFSDLFLLALAYLSFVFIGYFEALFETPTLGYVIRTLLLTVLILIFLLFRRRRTCIDQILDRVWDKLPSAPTMLYGLFFLALVVPSFLIRLKFIEAFPIDVKQGDMLPLIQEACQSLLKGEPVYKMYHLPHTLYLTYLPALWMAYLPAVALDLDLRFLGLLYLLVVVGIHLLFFTHSIKPTDPTQRLPQPTVASIAVLGSLLFFMYCPPFLFFTVNGHAYPFWMCLSAWVFFLWKKQWILAAAALGTIIAMRHFGLILLPFMIIYSLRNLPWRQLIPPAFVMAAVIGALCLPFYFQSPRAFLWEPLHEYSIIGQFYFDQPDRQHEVLNTIGFSNLFYIAGKAKFLSIVQWSLLGALILLATFRLKNLPQLIICCASALYIFIAFSIIPWFYLYIPVLLLLSLAIVIEALEPVEQPSNQP